MTFQVLISTMFEKDYSLLEKMNVQSDCVVVNQTDNNLVSKFKFQNHNIIWVNSTDRGLSKSRNLGLKYVTADIILLADNDEVFHNNYQSNIINEFSKTNADLLTFNINSIGAIKKRFTNLKYKKLNKFNIFRYGSARIAFLRNILDKHNITFNEKFGAGTPRLNGEDSLFLNSFLRNRAKCISSPLFIADINDTSSTWFKGYDEDYFYNKGYFFYELFPKKSRLAIYYYTFKHRKLFKNIGLTKGFKLMLKGRKSNKLRKEK
ncbi:MAG: glycosyltransferase [Bacilli bacterium]|nr:glycosyltransferase [Bacilli bacterium]